MFDNIGNPSPSANYQMGTDQGVESETTDEFPNAKRRGPYWNTPSFKSIIAFEAALVRSLRDLVRSGRVGEAELPVLLDRVRYGFTAEQRARWQMRNDPVITVISFLERWKKLMAASQDYRPLNDAVDLLDATKRRLRRRGGLWRGEPYWSNGKTSHGR